jgi:hypothetical protein
MRDLALFFRSDAKDALVHAVTSSKARRRYVELISGLGNAQELWTTVMDQSLISCKVYQPPARALAVL